MSESITSGGSCAGLRSARAGRAGRDSRGGQSGRGQCRRGGQGQGRGRNSTAQGQRRGRGDGQRRRRRGGSASARQRQRQRTERRTSAASAMAGQGGGVVGGGEEGFATPATCACAARRARESGPGCLACQARARPPPDQPAGVPWRPSANPSAACGGAAGTAPVQCGARGRQWPRACRAAMPRGGPCVCSSSVVRCGPWPHWPSCARVGGAR